MRDIQKEPTSEDIYKIRKDLQMSQVEFAELIGVDRRTIMNYEQGKKIPTTKMKLLKLMLENGAMDSIPDKSRLALKSIAPLEGEVDILKGEILDLKDHIKTLKDFLDEKNKLADMYRVSAYLKRQD
jgi:transcriptional regulator with XRE-family HTH domain